MEGPALRLRDVEGIVPLAAGCLLLAYIEGVSAARTFAAKHGYSLDPRQELLGIGAANLAAALGHGYPVAGGLSQSAVNDKAGARTPLALVFASITLALCLLFLTGLLENLPKAVLAAVVLTAIMGLFDFPGAAAHVAREPARLLRRGDCTGWRAAAWHSARHPASLHWPPYCCCWSARRARTSHFSAAFPVRTSTPTSPVIPTTRSCPA